MAWPQSLPPPAMHRQFPHVCSIRFFECHSTRTARSAPRPSGSTRARSMLADLVREGHISRSLRHRAMTSGTEFLADPDAIESGDAIPSPKWSLIPPTQEPLTNGFCGFIGVASASPSAGRPPAARERERRVGGCLGLQPRGDEDSPVGPMPTASRSRCRPRPGLKVRAAGMTRRTVESGCSTYSRGERHLDITTCPHNHWEIGQLPRFGLASPIRPLPCSSSLKTSGPSSPAAGSSPRSCCYSASSAGMARRALPRPHPRGESRPS